MVHVSLDSYLKLWNGLLTRCAHSSLENKHRCNLKSKAYSAIEMQRRFLSLHACAALFTVRMKKKKIDSSNRLRIIYPSQHPELEAQLMPRAYDECQI
ncbi:hypothetical protein TSAR_001077 [Trichomalopsis sarcophagae]|uniref:Uncharacterized protein n=1 Tax=Trichomalopsis sarcophagae TaxID=543379 RepID=A0A232ELJ7_9HYME|nr:hypothetical protein TSAR_001077 [Trichomalopsis sarcophagae]